MLSILSKGELSYYKVNHLMQRRIPLLSLNKPKHKITISNVGLAELLVLHLHIKSRLPHSILEDVIVIIRRTKREFINK